MRTESRHNLNRGRGHKHVDSQVSAVQGAVGQTSSARQACQLPLRLDLEMKSFLRASLVLLWVWFVCVFGPKSKPKS